MHASLKRHFRHFHWVAGTPRALREAFQSLPKSRVKAAFIMATAATLTAGMFAWKPWETKIAAPLAPLVPPVGTIAPKTLVLDRNDLQVAPATEGTPLLVRILEAKPVENGRTQYQLSYSGLEEGVFNLTDYLNTPDGKRLREPLVQVQVASFVPKNATYAIANLPPIPLENPFPYGKMLGVSSLAWMLCGVWTAVAYFKKTKPLPTPPTEQEAAPAPVQEPDTLAELLRPLVEKAADKTISHEEKARLEQILFLYWGTQLELDHLNSVEQLRRILEHEQAGALLRKVEQWLYQPNSPIPPEEITEILNPYMALPVKALHTPLPGVSPGAPNSAEAPPSYSGAEDQSEQSQDAQEAQS